MFFDIWDKLFFANCTDELKITINSEKYIFFFFLTEYNVYYDSTKGLGIKEEKDCEKDMRPFPFYKPWEAKS